MKKRRRASGPPRRPLQLWRCWRTPRHPPRRLRALGALDRPRSRLPRHPPRLPTLCQVQAADDQRGFRTASRTIRAMKTTDPRVCWRMKLSRHWQMTRSQQQKSLAQAASQLRMAHMCNQHAWWVRAPPVCRPTSSSCSSLASSASKVSCTARRPSALNTAAAAVAHLIAGLLHAIAHLNLRLLACRPGRVS